MAAVFEPIEINGMKLDNRFVRSATWESMATDEGAVTKGLTDKMVELAQGGVGLIITGHAFVHPEGQAGPRQMGAYSDDLLPGMTTMANAVHDNGGKIVLQINHAGFQAPPNLTGQPPLCVSVGVEHVPTDGREMTTDDITTVIEAMGQAASRAKAAGFDGVQIHCAHGYLLSQFLSSSFNQRTDEYGGTVDNRARVLLEVYQAVRQAVGADYPVLVKMNCQDFLEGGLVTEDSRQAALMLEAAGIDAVEISGGTFASGPLNPVRPGKITPEKEVFYRDEARFFKEKLGVPLMVVGGIRTLDKSEELVASGMADFISMCRPLIREPGLINRWRSGDTRPATCLSDNMCFRPVVSGEGLYCLTEKREKQKEKEKQEEAGN